MSGGDTLRVGTRGSALALRQTGEIIARMERAAPGSRFETVKVVTHGDRFQEIPITGMGGEVERGIFNTGLEDAILRGEVDFTTCSFKDVQSELRPTLTATSVAPREDHRDVLVSRHGVPLADLPRNATLATSSPRRISQLKAFRPDFRFVPLRGNVPTRVERESKRFDGIVLAAAGLIRLGMEAHICAFIDEAVLLPAPAQGALGCEYRAGHRRVEELVQAIRHPETELCVRTEKALLVRLSGGCFAPIGVLAQVRDGRLTVRCRVASLDGRKVVEAAETGAPDDAPAMLEALTARIAGQGGLAIVQAVREELQAGSGG
jgi:hydroxymethylbilane synthase